MSLTPEQRWQLRLAVIAGATDCPLSLDEAAAFFERSESWLRRSDVPRADAGGPVFLKSQILAYLRKRTSHLIDESTPALRKAS